MLKPGCNSITFCLWILIGVFSSNVVKGQNQCVNESSKIPISLQISHELILHGMLKLPPNLKPNQKVPVLLVFGGFESADRVLDLIHINIPIALASFDYPFDAPRRIRFPQSFPSLFQARQLFPQTMKGIQELIRLLKQRAEIDSSQMIIVGASFGAPFALAAASEFPEIQGLVIVHGFGLVAETVENVILRSWLPKYGNLIRPLAWIFSHLGWTYLGLKTPEELTTNLRHGQRVLMITAESDSFIPRRSSDSLWNALTRSHAQVTRRLMKSDHLMPGSDHLIAEIIELIQDWM